MQIGSVKDGLSDRNQYPRKTAALGVLKVMDYAPAAVESAQLLPVLRILLMEDPSPEARLSRLTAHPRLVVWLSPFFPERCAAGLGQLPDCPARDGWPSSPSHQAHRVQAA